MEIDVWLPLLRASQVCWLSTVSPLIMEEIVSWLATASVLMTFTFTSCWAVLPFSHTALIVTVSSFGAEISIGSVSIRTGESAIARK